jgi:hypothetical protein
MKTSSLAVSAAAVLLSLAAPVAFAQTAPDAAPPAAPAPAA